MEYILRFDKICDSLNLGTVVSEPYELSGGHLHRMFAIETDKGKFAVKLLNPQVMLRPKAMRNYIDSERIARLVAKGVPALPALAFDGSSIQKMDGQFYLVFEWVCGTIFPYSQINVGHCEKMGSVLADIHLTDFSELKLTNDYSTDEPIADWGFYLRKGEERQAVWVDLMRDNIKKLYDFSSKLEEASRILSVNTLISHRDLEPKNVLWNNELPIIIDWEAAGYVNPFQDMVETAVYWAKDEKGVIVKEKFLSFVGAYGKKRGRFDADWPIVLSKGFSGLLGWLEYSLKRLLRIECADEAEQKMGTEHVIYTINDALRYFDMIPKLQKWLSDYSNQMKF